MSYTIMYGKQFLKTSRGIIPLALHGDNNVTERVRGREVRERHWSVYANDKIEFAPDEYLAYLQSFCGNEYREHFYANGKFVNDKGLIAWAKNGIREALTIEEIRKIIPVQSVTCYILVGIKDSYESRTEEWRYCNTTKELETWLDMAYARVEELKPVSRYAVICLSLYGRNPLCIAARREPEGKVILRVGSDKYLSELSPHGYSLSPDITQALVFNSPADARNAVARSGQYLPRKFRFLSADEKRRTKTYRVKAFLPAFPQGIYIKRLGKYSLRFCHEEAYALKFSSAKLAQEYIDKLGDRFKDISYAVVQLQEA